MGISPIKTTTALSVTNNIICKQENSLYNLIVVVFAFKRTFDDILLNEDRWPEPFLFKAPCV